MPRYKFFLIQYTVEPFPWNVLPLIQAAGLDPDEKIGQLKSPIS